MHAKSILSVLLPVLAVAALPAKRDGVVDLTSQLNEAATNPGALATLESEIMAQGTAAATLLPELSAFEASAISSFKAAVGPSQTQLTAFFTTVSGTPLMEISSIGGPAVTLAPTGGVTTTFAGFTVTAVPPKKNGAAALSISRPLMGGMIGALGVVAGGAFMIL
ncbi:hypothetical protein BD311DRAFT_424614 [Dichomitus squalens]|uniref:Uncharacterized protein n=1 Tax=Dichomitus squalens TaxID=114155 RepID=A0A4Q9MKU9_9APHY|nr:hypothetical protein BD311DRAFT_424614 [Dichomitus squalens]